MIDVRSSGKRGAELLLRLRRPEVRFAGDGVLDLDQAKSIESELQKPFLVEADPNGRLQHVRLSAGVSPASAGFARSLASSVQFVWPARALPAWEVEQDDPTGTARVLYERSGATVRLTRLGYRTPAEPDDPDEVRLTPVVEPEGFLTATVDFGKRRLLAVEGSETVTLTLNQQVVGRSETKVALSLAGVETVAEEEERQLLREQSALSVGAASGSLINPAPGEEARHRAELGAATVDQLLAELSRVEQKDETALYLKFRA